MDTESLENDPGCGKLADFVPLTNYRYDMAARNSNSNICMCAESKVQFICFYRILEVD